MASVVHRLREAGLINPPPWMASNVVYETVMGSVAYGVSDDDSDEDIYGIVIPPKNVIFPHLAGHIHGFGRQRQEFEVWQQHHVLQTPSVGKEKSYDLQVYNIVKFFSLAMENNPNIIDSLFTPQFCVRSLTQVGQLVRDNRRIFLHKGSWHKFKGYSYSQLHKMSGQKREGKRAEVFEKWGFDLKFAYHVVRLLYEAEMILNEGDLDLQRHREHLKSIRRGDVKEEEIRQWASDKEAALERAYENSKLQHTPDEGKIKTLLLQCLEAHYGTLEAAAVVQPEAPMQALREVFEVLERHRALLEK